MSAEHNFPRMVVLGCLISVLYVGVFVYFVRPLIADTSHHDAIAIDRAAVLLIESDIDADTRRAGVEALAELLRVRRQG